MKQVENSFVITGFVAKDAEIRTFTNNDVARFPMQSAARKPRTTPPTACPPSSTWKPGARAAAHRSSC